MPQNFLETPIEYLKGVGPIRAELLKKELNIFTFEDMMEYYPFRYIDKSKFYSVVPVYIMGIIFNIKKLIPEAILLARYRKTIQSFS